jgi:hypothetical protein
MEKRGGDLGVVYADFQFRNLERRSDSCEGGTSPLVSRSPSRQPYGSAAGRVFAAHLPDPQRVPHLAEDQLRGQHVHGEEQRRHNACHRANDVMGLNVVRTLWRARP